MRELEPDPGFADDLVGDTLLAVLRQLRTGYVDRPARFPHSIILYGVRDVRDYWGTCGSGGRRSSV